MNRSPCLSVRDRILSPAILLPLFITGMILCGTAGAAEANAAVSQANTTVYYAGDEITLGGGTNLAPGTQILVTVEAAAFQPTGKDDPGVSSGISGTVMVQEGTPPFWAFSFSTEGWAPGEYLFTIESPKTGSMESGTFTLHPPVVSPSPTASPLPSPTATPSATPAASLPTPTDVSLSFGVVIAAGCAAACLLRIHGR